MSPEELEAIPLSQRTDLSCAIDTAPDIPVKFHDLGKVYWKGRQWVVNADGIERHDGKTYQITVDRIGNLRPWDLSSLEAKTWIDFADFMAAYELAVELLAQGKIGTDRYRGA